MEPNAAIKIGEIRQRSLSIEVGKNAFQAAMCNPLYAAMIAHDDQPLSVVNPSLLQIFSMYDTTMTNIIP